MSSSTTSLLQDLHSLVTEELKVVSYKWLARQYAVPSNYAKQVLFQFAEQHASKVKTVYLVSGILKSELNGAHVVRLVDAKDLAACTSDFATRTSIHVHSVMPAESNPITDPARLWAEDTQQSRHFYQSVVKDGALQNGSTDVFARNSCSTIKFSTDVVPIHNRKQLAQPQQHLQPQQQQQEQQRPAAQPASKMQHPAVKSNGKENGKALGNPAAPPKPDPSAAAAAASPPPAVKPATKAVNGKQNSDLANLWSKAPKQGAARPAAVASAAAGSRKDTDGRGTAGTTAAAAAAAAAAAGRQHGRQTVIQDDDEAPEGPAVQQPTGRKPRGRMVLDSDDAEDDDQDQLLAAVQAPKPAATAAPHAAGAGKSTVLRRKRKGAEASSDSQGNDSDEELLAAVGDFSTEAAVVPAAGVAGPAKGTKDGVKDDSAAEASRQQPTAGSKRAPAAGSKLLQNQQQQQQQQQSQQLHTKQDADDGSKKCPVPGGAPNSTASVSHAAGVGLEQQPAPDRAQPDHSTPVPAAEQAAVAEDEPAAKRKKSSGPRLDPVTGEEIWGDEEQAAPAGPATGCQQQKGGAAVPEAKGKPAAAATAAGSGSGKGAQKSAAAGASGGSKSGGGSKGSKVGVAAKKGQKNITSFFGKR